MSDLLPDGLAALRLHRPPVIAAIGVGVHGVPVPRDSFLLPGLWQFHLYAYEGELDLGGLTHVIRPGHVSLVPPGERVSFRYLGRSEHLFAHLRLPSAGPVREVPVMQDAGPAAPAIGDMLRQAVTAAHRRPEQAAAEVWAALWRTACLARPAAEGRHAAVAKAMEFIEAHLSEPMTVPRIARHSDVSHTHLTRLFRAETGETVVAYLRRRRLERAEHLLRRSTLPIPAIASSVGIPDLQAFNKACHRELGASPRAVRNAPR